MSIGVLVASGLVLVGSVLPWISVTFVLGTIEVAGTRGDGKLTAALAAAGGILAIVSLANKARGPMIGAAIVLSIAAAVAVYDLINITSYASGLDGNDDVFA
jgi:hypothetical protein